MSFPIIASDRCRRGAPRAIRRDTGDDATFRGPLAGIDGVESVVQGLQGLAPIATDTVVHKRFVDGATSSCFA
jgi:hypothetical protein